MPKTWGQLKTTVRNDLWPGGEQINLVAAHDRYFVDAIMDIQKWVECAQQDNTNVVPQCSTYYRCGMTVLDAPRGRIKQVAIIDKINPETGEEDATAADDYCSEIVYSQIKFCYVEAYLQRSAHAGCCLPIPFFFGLYGCNKANYPIPTDEGLPAGLKPLPLGFHYPQTSTDRKYGRAHHGVWALDRGKIYIVPWIQSTETVIVKWDGLKREWGDSDLIESDPDLERAIGEYVRKEHMDKFDKEEGEFVRASTAYADALAKLIHECREETRVRGCEPSNARWSSPGGADLYYNEQQSATASCTPPSTGSPVTVTIPAGTVASNVSIADANAKAQTQAQSQAQAQLVCAGETTTYWNDAQTATAACQGEQGAPPPDGNPVVLTIPAHTISSTISTADANQKAAALAQSQAAAQLTCTFWNSEQTYLAVCASDNSIKVQKTVSAHTYSSTVSQADADAQALADATNQANAALEPLCTGATVYWNTPQLVTVSKYINQGPGGKPPCLLTVTVDVPIHVVSSLVSQLDANQQAQAAGQLFATLQWNQLASTYTCGGPFLYTLPW